MYRIDVPMAPPLPEDARDIAVENINLVGTVVEGTVRVRQYRIRKMDCGALHARQVADDIGSHRPL